MGNRVFQKHTESTKMAILASQALLRENVKKKNPALNSLPQPFKSNALLSEPLEFFTISTKYKNANIANFILALLLKIN